MKKIIIYKTTLILILADYVFQGGPCGCGVWTVDTGHTQSHTLTVTLDSGRVLIHDHTGHPV